MEFLRRLQQQLRDLWLGMSVALRTALVAVIVLALVALVFVGFWAKRIEYQPLFTNLTAEESAAATAFLRSRAVDFTRSTDGAVISVPADRVHQLRLDAATAGVAIAAGKGLAIFEETNIGRTPFDQQVLYQRAIQEELAKTIRRIDPVADVRVHIVRPEPSPFLRDREKTPPKASVQLTLKPGATLTRSQAASIVALVSRSVEGLNPDNVTVVDQTGRTVSEPVASDALNVGWKLEYQRNLENYLASKAEEVLVKRLGTDRVIVRVTANIDFKKLKETTNTVSPEKIVVSEELSSSKSQGGGRGGIVGTPNIRPGQLGAGQIGAGTFGSTTTPVSQSSETSNSQYKALAEVTRTIENGLGSVQRLTVAAMVNLSPDDNRPGLSRTEAENLIKEAVGFQAGRDSITVSDVKLEPPPEKKVELPPLYDVEKVLVLVRYVSLGLVALVALLLVAMLFLRLKRAIPVVAPPEPVDVTRVRERLTTLAQRDPELVARLLATWLEQPASRGA